MCMCASNFSFNLLCIVVVWRHTRAQSGNYTASHLAVYRSRMHGILQNRSLHGILLQEPHEGILGKQAQQWKPWQTSVRALVWVDHSNMSCRMIIFAWDFWHSGHELEREGFPVIKSSEVFVPSSCKAQKDSTQSGPAELQHKYLDQLFAMWEE